MKVSDYQEIPGELEVGESRSDGYGSENGRWCTANINRCPQHPFSRGENPHSVNFLQIVHID